MLYCLMPLGVGSYTLCLLYNDILIHLTFSGAEILYGIKWYTPYSDVVVPDQDHRWRVTGPSVVDVTAPREATSFTFFVTSTGGSVVR